MIVVAIILIIAAIAIPNLLRSRIAANESSAVGSIRTLNTAEVTYSSTYPDLGFTCTLANLGPPSGSASATSTSAGLIDSVLASGAKSGYTFALTGCTAAGSSTILVTYQSQGVPVAIGQTGQRAFCSDQSGVIKYDSGGSGTTCTSSGSALQ
ncbi:MAG TPA: pili assembly chaperone [Terriglobales bacterium]|nr:pili assembly chaperone [Terriglobales bacterium]